MKFKVIISFLFLCTVHCFAQENDKEIVSRLNRDRIASYEKKDTLTMEKILAHDFVMVTSTGKKISRKV